MEKPSCAAFPTRMGSSGGPSHSERIFHFEGKGFDSTLGYPGEGPGAGSMVPMQQVQQIAMGMAMEMMRGRMMGALGAQAPQVPIIKVAPKPVPLRAGRLCLGGVAPAPTLGGHLLLVFEYVLPFLGNHPPRVYRDHYTYKRASWSPRNHYGFPGGGRRELQRGLGLEEIGSSWNPSSACGAVPVALLRGDLVRGICACCAERETILTDPYGFARGGCAAC